MTGTLRDRPFAEIVGDIFQGKQTGELRVAAAGKTITIHFQDGNPVAAASDDPGHRIARILLDNEKIGPGEAEMLGGLPESKQAFETVEYIPGEILLWGVKFRFLRLLEELFSWEEGDYSFSEVPVPPEALTLRVPTPFIVFTGTAKMPDSFFGAVSDEKVITEIREIPAAEEGFFNPQRKKFLASCKKGERIGDLLSSMSGDRERARHTLYALRALGLVVVADPPPAALEPQLIVEPEPEPVPESAPEPVVPPAEAAPADEPLSLFGDDDEEKEVEAPAPAEEAPLSPESEEEPEGEVLELEPEAPVAAEPELALDEEPVEGPPELELPESPDAAPAPELPLEPPPEEEGRTDDEPALPFPEKSDEPAGGGGAFTLPDDDLSLPDEAEEGVSLSTSLGLGLEKESVETPPSPEAEEPPGRKRRLARPSLRAGRVAAIGGVLLLVVAGSLVGLKFFGGEEPPPPPPSAPPPAALPSAPSPAAPVSEAGREDPAAEPVAEGAVETALPAGSSGAEDTVAAAPGQLGPPGEQEEAPAEAGGPPPPSVAAVESPEAAPPEEVPPALPGAFPAGEPASAMPVDAAEALAAGDIDAAARAWAEKLRGSPEGTYTLQVLMVCEAESVAESYPALAGHGQVYVVPFSLKGRNCYRFGLGTYPSLENAKAARAGLPEGIRQGGAVIKSLKLFLPEEEPLATDQYSSEEPSPPAAAAPAVTPEDRPPVKAPAAEWEKGRKLFESGDLPAAAEHWRQMLASSPPGTYTLQILTACDAATVGNYFRLFEEHGRVFAVPVVLKGKACYRAGLETFPSKKAAEAALQLMPQWVRDQRTVVKNVDLLVR